MLLEEAKQRSDYKFTLNGIENCIDGIRHNWMDDMLENGDPYRGIVVMEVGFVDIEVNIFTEEQIGNTSGGKVPVIGYFVCVKGEKEWRSDDYTEDPVQVDWNADNWVEQLERDMFKSLDKYVAEKGYSYDHAN